MNESIFDQIQEDAKYLNLDFSSQEMAQFALDKDMSEENVQAASEIFSYLKEKKKQTIVNTQLRLSRLPLKEPKTFDNFNFGLIHGKQTETLKGLPSLSALYARKNLAFIGPQGVGKTHLAMAFGRECCLKGMKTYFLKATELNQRFTDARKYGRESSTIIKPIQIAHLQFILAI